MANTPLQVTFNADVVRVNPERWFEGRNGNTGFYSVSAELEMTIRAGSLAIASLDGSDLQAGIDTWKIDFVVRQNATVQKGGEAVSPNPEMYEALRSLTPGSKVSGEAALVYALSPGQQYPQMRLYVNSLRVEELAPPAAPGGSLVERVRQSAAVAGRRKAA